jgi:hypothetical protein
LPPFLRSHLEGDTSARRLAPEARAPARRFAKARLAKTRLTKRRRLPTGRSC